jgi:hypothetical protein
MTVNKKINKQVTKKEQHEGRPKAPAELSVQNEMRRAP